MKPNTSPILILAGLAATLLLCGCRSQSADDYVERLPDLPPDLAATLDPATLATRPPAFAPPETAPVPEALCPCCGSTDTKSLRVTYSYTKCGPLRDFIVAPLADAILFRSGPQETRSYRLRKLNATVLDQHICLTSQGPWNATLIEQRNCKPCGPIQTLTISAFGDLISFNWPGGVENHPPEVGLVSCRHVGTTRFICNGLSDCDCKSTSCPASEPCPCNLPW